jgi:hypothetical protein
VKLTTHLHLVPSSRMRGAIPPLPQYIFMLWCLVTHKENFAFYLLCADNESVTKVFHLSPFSGEICICDVQKYMENVWQIWKVESMHL